jgi:AcrR family transcriptional regulator
VDGLPQARLGTVTDRRDLNRRDLNRRDENKARRRDAILDAATALLAERHSDEVSTEEIATLAGVAPATIYNLVGTRDDVVRALVDRVMTELRASLEAIDESDPIAGARLVVDQTVAAFVADSKVFRQVVAIAQRAGPRRPGGAMPSDAQVPLMRRAQAMGILRDDVDAAGIARQIFVSYTGAMALWSAGRLDDAGFSTAARLGLYTSLAAAASDAHREGFLRQIAVLSRTLETDAWQGTEH